jgi:LmbE family N-acetylglucosaminyl deacetylase
MNSPAEWKELSRWRLSGDQESCLRIAVLAAHPDDETIGASALLGRFQNAEVLYLTDGAPRDRKLWSPDARGSREDYVRLRREEAQTALALVDIAPEQVTWLGATDQEAILDVGDLTERLVQFLEVSRPSVLITHAYEGGHPDHDTAALVARLAISGADSRCVLLEMTSYHAESGRCVTGQFLNNGVGSEIVFKLSEEERTRKRRMMAAHSSQREVLSGFAIDHERLRLAPEYDFSRPPHTGSLWYECMGWEMTGERWRSLARIAVRDMQERNAAHSA